MKRLLVVGVGVVDVVSAAVHASLVPAHLREAPVLALLFGIASVGLLALGVVMVRGVVSDRVAAWNVALLAGLLVGYSVSRLTGLPIVGEGREPLDAVGVATQVLELGALLALSGSLLLRRVWSSDRFGVSISA